MNPSQAAVESKTIQIRPGDRLVCLDADGKEAEYVVLSVIAREDETGQTVASFVLRQREGWTTVVGGSALVGPAPRFRVANTPREALA